MSAVTAAYAVSGAQIVRRHKDGFPAGTQALPCASFTLSLRRERNDFQLSKDLAGQIQRRVALFLPAIQAALHRSSPQSFGVHPNFPSTITPAMVHDIAILPFVQAFDRREVPEALACQIVNPSRFLLVCHRAPHALQQPGCVHKYPLGFFYTGTAFVEKEILQRIIPRM